MSTNNIIIDDAAHAATGQVTFNEQPSDGDTIAIAGKTYTFQSVLTNVDGHVLIGTYTLDTVNNLAAAINLYVSPNDIKGVKAGREYAAAMTVNANVSALVSKAGSEAPILNLTAKATGTGGNAYGLVASNTSAMTVSGATMLGGTTGVTADGQQSVISWYGGYCNIDVQGTFASASVQLQCCTKIPASGNPADIAAADWVPLGAALTQAGQFSSFLNPCLLSATVSAATGTSKVRVVVQPS